MTRRQRQLHDFIAAYAAENNYCPSYAEMMTALGLRSKSSVHRLVSALQSQGLLKRQYYRARTIELLTPDNRPDLHQAFTNFKQEISHYFIRGVDLRDTYQVAHINGAFKAFENLLTGPGMPVISAPDAVLSLTDQTVSA